MLPWRKSDELRVFILPVASNLETRSFVFGMKKGFIVQINTLSRMGVYVRSRTGFPSNKNPFVVKKDSVFYVLAFCSMVRACFLNDIFTGNFFLFPQ